MYTVFRPDGSNFPGISDLDAAKAKADEVPGSTVHDGSGPIYTAPKPDEPQ